MRRGYSDQDNKQQGGRSITQKKSLGQVFLNTDWPVNKVVENALDLGIKRVIEIGPGNGILTIALANAGIKVTAIEKDDRFAARLKDLTLSEKQDRLQNVEVLNVDILKFDLDEWIKAGDGIPCGVVGNIPYNISTPIVMWVLPHIAALKGAIFMVQLEFANRIVSQPDSKNYGSLSVYCQLRAHCDFNFKVERTCFTPVPKVDSAVMTLRPRTQLPATGKRLQYTETVCRIAFAQRRKKLRSGVKQFMHKLNEETCPIDLNRRAETLTPEDFVALASFLFGDKL
jgi:16S rRNA (adenine1518-N6/adenine1519-N6)-dimethyltransferase